MELIFTIIREAICTTIFTLIFGIILSWEINGVCFEILIEYTIRGFNSK